MNQEHVAGPLQLEIGGRTIQGEGHVFTCPTGMPLWCAYVIRFGHNQPAAPGVGQSGGSHSSPAVLTLPDGRKANVRVLSASAGPPFSEYAGTGSLV